MSVRSPFVLIAFAVTSVAALFASCSKSAKVAPPVTGDHSFAVVFSQLNFGNIEPCSCNNRTQGGFPRRATLLKEIREKHQHVLSVDAGDSLFAERFDIPEATYMPQAKAKAREIAVAFVKCGLDAYVFGELDLRAGSKFFKSVVKESGLPVLAANVVDAASGERVFDAYKIFDVGGVKVAVIGLVSPQLKQMGSVVAPDGSQKFAAANEARDLADLCDDKEWRFEEPIPVAQELVNKLRGEANIVCILSHLPPKVAKSLPATVQGVDFVFGSHKPNNDVVHSVEHGGLFLGAGSRGVAIGLAEFTVRNGSLMFSDHTQIEKDRKAMPQVIAWRDEIAKQYGSDDPDRLEQIDEKIAVRMAGYADKIAKFEALTKQAESTAESWFNVTSLHLDEKVADDPELATLVRNYRKGLKNLYRADDTTRAPELEPTAGQAHVVTDQACAKCHQQQYDFWHDTKHGHAWQTMIEYDAQYDLDCIVCHTVGYMQPGGFDRPDRVAQILEGRDLNFENVQCENCHGMGSNHAENFGFLDESAITAHSSMMGCERCHDRHHSPSFKRETFVPRVSCPPIDPADPVTRGLFAQMQEAMKKQLSNADRAQRAYPAYVDLCLRLGRNEDALATADEGYEKFPQIRRLRVASARALDAMGRTGDALARLNDLYNDAENAKNPLIIREMVDLLLHGRDISRRSPDEAIQLCDWALTGLGFKESSWARLRAEALYATGKRKEARSYIRKIAGQSDEFAGELSDMLARWKRETDAREEYRAPGPIQTPPRAP